MILSVRAFPAFKEKYFQQRLDHFRPDLTTTWKHRYLFNDDHWGKKQQMWGSMAREEKSMSCKGPILFYTGNEGPIDAFWASNGFMLEVLAPKFGALVVFGEERFYGKSLPFGADSSLAANRVFLSTEQILNDYVDLLDHIKTSLNATDCPAIAFGGSYGGTLTTLLRATYPAAVIGGLAASAPIGYYDPLHWAAHSVDEFTWSDIANRVYREAETECMPAIHAATRAIRAADSAVLTKAFHVCEAAGLGPDKADLFLYALESLPQQNYPYQIGSTPGWPVNHTCSQLVAAMHDPKRLLAAAASVTDMVIGYDGKNCLPTLQEGPGGVPGDGPGSDSWGYQSCTETLHGFSARGFRNYTFSYEVSGVETCKRLYNGTVRPDMDSLTRRYGGYKLGDGLAGITNIIWSNGLLDPWHGGGFLKPRANDRENHWFLLAKGAHHLDLRGPHPEDPAELTAVRKAEEAILQKWLAKYFASL